ncbi:hypothetical protein [Propionivibrio sp.]|uniref:hypothetical protein n=1 Tax=Propionivibrio sp. TaxID=2212460 RepID=UPI0025ECDA79|nr:hypothetical protein [Propionivibrio sp.]
MKIPAEALSLYLSESDNKALAEGQRAGPVEGSARLRATLARASPEQGRSREKSDAADERSKDHELKRQKRRGMSVSVERRQNDRRKENIPVLLDTRTKRCRRSSSVEQSINFRI